MQLLQQRLLLYLLLLRVNLQSVSSKQVHQISHCTAQLRHSRYRQRQWVKHNLGFSRLILLLVLRQLRSLQPTQMLT